MDAVDTGRSGRSRIVVYGGGDIVFDCVHCVLHPLCPLI